MPAQKPTREWLSLTQAGLQALACGDQREAIAPWLSAADLARAAGLSEPRQAAAQNNAGIAYLVCEQTNDALGAFFHARRHWARARNILRAEPLSAAGKSSIFHLQLAMQHHDAFAAAQRRRYERLCQAAHGITVLNRCLATGSLPSNERLRAFADELADVFGPQCSELSILADLADEAAASASTRPLPTPSPYEGKARRLMQLDHTELDQAGEIALAARLTLLLHPASRHALPCSGERSSLEERN